MPLTIVRGLTPGSRIPSPAYLDANVLIAYFVQRSNSLVVAQAIAELLVQRVMTLLSPLTIAECWIFDARYNRDRAGRGDPPQRLTAGEYRRRRVHLLTHYSNEIELIRRHLQTWPTLEAVPFQASDLPGWLRDYDGAFDACELLPSDLPHLSLALGFARSFVTTDREFLRAASDRELTIIVL